MSLAVHTTGFAPKQAPDVQVSVCVHALPSVHTLPSGFNGFEQMPVGGLHVPAVWQLLLAAHTTGLPPVHKPD